MLNLRHGVVVNGKKHLPATSQGPFQCHAQQKPLVSDDTERRLQGQAAAAATSVWLIQETRAKGEWLV